MSDAPVVPEAKGVSVELLATVDLGPEIEGMEGVGWPEDRDTLHWLENRGPVLAVEISVDVVNRV